VTPVKNSTKVYVPHGVSERFLADGRPLEPGTFIELTNEQVSDNQRLIDEEKLLLAPTTKKGD
jgi:hypothetical protein